jgi:cell division protein FtsB
MIRVGTFLYRQRQSTFPLLCRLYNHSETQRDSTEVKQYVIVMVLAGLLVGCATARNGGGAVDGSAEPKEVIARQEAELARLREENAKLRAEAESANQREPDEQDKTDHSKRSRSSTDITPRKVITYNEFLSKYTICGKGKYGYVSLDASYSELLERLSIILPLFWTSR